MKSKIDAGWSSLVARRAHNPKVSGSNPDPATKQKSRGYVISVAPFLCFNLKVSTYFPTLSLKFGGHFLVFL